MPRDRTGFVLWYKRLEKEKFKWPIEKSQASAGLLAYIAVGKYADSLPLYRQSIILSRFGIEMNRTTLANWMIKCGELAQPLINRFEEQLLNQPYIHMDETQPKVSPKTILGKALHYLAHQRPRLIGYLEDGRYPIDNNPVENAIRPFAIGRFDYAIHLVRDFYVPGH